MTRLLWNLWDDADKFDLGDSGGRPGEYLGKKGLYLQKTCSAVLLREQLPLECFRLQAEVAIPGTVGFIGLVFGAQNSQNYELVYLAPQEIQYDPVINGSMTWQIYNGPLYQKPLPETTGKWVKFAVEVQPNGAAVYLGDDPEPQLVMSQLQHGGAAGKIGVWGYLPSYIRNFSVEEIKPGPIRKSATDLRQLTAETYITEWMVSQPFSSNGQPKAQQHWTKAVVEENGTLNVNRLFTAETGIFVQAKTAFLVSEAKETEISFGFSDHLRLWVNDEEVYQGEWRWDPPARDGRIRSDFARVPIRWRAGLNTIRAEISHSEFFGWGLSLRTGLPDMIFLNDQG